MKKLLVLVAFMLCAWGITIASETLDGDLTGQPTFNRRFSVSYSIECNASSYDSANNNIRYLVYDIYTTAYEPLLASTTLGSLSDSVMFLYCANFDPAHPEQNLVAWDDDSGPGFASAFLPGHYYYVHPYTRYQLVVTSFGEGQSGTFTLTLDGNAHFLANLPVSFVIEATSSSGGAITPSGALQALPLSIKTFHMMPDPGYHGLDLIVDGRSIGYRDSYSFTHILSDHTIHAEFVKSEDPVITAFTADPRSGLSPLPVHFTAEANDPDGGNIAQYLWDLDGDGQPDQITTEGTLNHRFLRSGQFDVTVTAVDEEGATAVSQPISITVSSPARIHLPLMTDNNLTKQAALGPDFHGDTWVINPMEQTASVTLTATDASGETVGQTTDLVPALGKMKLSVDAFDGLSYTEIMAEPDRYVISLAEVSGSHARMAAYLRMPLTSTLVVPHIAEETSYWDTVAFVTNDYLDLMDILLGDEAIPLAPTHAGVWDVTGLALGALDEPAEGDMWATFRCHADNPFSSTRSMTGFEMFIKQDGDGAATELTADGSERLYIPHIPTETEIFWTGFAFVNPGSEDITATVQFFNDAGEAAGTGQLTVPAGKKVKGLMSDLFPDALADAAWGVLNASDKLVGLELYGTTDGICGFGLDGYATATGVFPLMLTGTGEWTGIALANPNDVDAPVTIELVDEHGTIVGAHDAVVPANGRFAFVAAEYFDRYRLAETDYIRFRSMYGLVGVEAAGDDSRSYMVAIGAGF